VLGHIPPTLRGAYTYCNVVAHITVNGRVLFRPCWNPACASFCHVTTDTAARSEYVEVGSDVALRTGNKRTLQQSRGPSLLPEHTQARWQLDMMLSQDPRNHTSNVCARTSVPKNQCLCAKIRCQKNKFNMHPFSRQHRSRKLEPPIHLCHHPALALAEPTRM
jgi:hypothetical protein